MSTPYTGQTRCYWVLLSPDLDFLVTDPVLTSHLAEQAQALIGKNVLDFVHPDEQASARHDLRTVLDTRTLHGSVTRVRYSRLSRVRRQLGFTGEIEHSPAEEKVAFDKDYLACDIVINWAADGLVLCFIHAVVDLSPEDNNEVNKTQWSNWCGTPGMGGDHTTPLYHHLISSAPTRNGPPTRVFQILANVPDRNLLFTWPCDGYVVDEFSRLAAGVQIGGTNGSDAKTSCTRRYKAMQSLPGNKGDVESIFIPHGAIIFACHKVILPQKLPHIPPPPQFAYTSHAASAGYYESQSSYDLAQRQLPPPTPPTHYSNYPPPPPLTATQEHWPSPSHGVYDRNQPYDQYAASSPWAPTGGSTPSPSSSAPPSRNGFAWAGGHYVEHHHAHHNLPPLPPIPRHHSTSSSGTYEVNNTSIASSSYDDGYNLHEVPPPPKTRQRMSLGPTEDDHARLSPASASSREGFVPVGPLGGGGRSGGQPPSGINRCASCKITSSPEWRKGPSGKKDLCNACGLRYARSRAKKEGLVVQRRRKDTAGGHLKASAPRSSTGSNGKRAQAQAQTQAIVVDTPMNEHGMGRMMANLTPSPSPPGHPAESGYPAGTRGEYLAGRAEEYDATGYREYEGQRHSDPRYPEDPRYTEAADTRYPEEDHYSRHTHNGHGRTDLYSSSPGPLHGARYDPPPFGTRNLGHRSHHQSLGFDRSADRSTSTSTGGGGSDGSGAGGTNDMLPPTPISAPPRHASSREATFVGH